MSLKSDYFFHIIYIGLFCIIFFTLTFITFWEYGLFLFFLFFLQTINWLLIPHYLAELI